MNEQIKPKKEKRPLNRPTKIAILISAFLVGNLALLALIGGVVSVRPLHTFHQNAESVHIVSAFGERVAVSQATQDEIERAINSASHSFLRGVVDGRTGGIVPRTLRSGGQDIRRTFTPDTTGQIFPADDGIMLEFSFKDIQTLDEFYYYRDYIVANPDRPNHNPVRHQIRFDRLLVIIPAPQPGIQRIRLIPYLDHNITNTTPGQVHTWTGEGVSWPDAQGRLHRHFYTIHEFETFAYTRELVNIIMDAETIAN